MCWKHILRVNFLCCWRFSLRGLVDRTSCHFLFLSCQIFFFVSFLKKIYRNEMYNLLRGYLIFGLPSASVRCEQSKYTVDERPCHWKTRAHQHLVRAKPFNPMPTGYKYIHLIGCAALEQNHRTVANLMHASHIQPRYSTVRWRWCTYTRSPPGCVWDSSLFRLDQWRCAICPFITFSPVPDFGLQIKLQQYFSDKHIYVRVWPLLACLPPPPPFPLTVAEQATK